MRWVAILASIAVSGCFESRLRVCENGAICPESLVCTERTPTECGDEPNVTACLDQADLTACSSSLVPVGSCMSGVCSACTADLIECRYPEWRTMRSPTAQPLAALWAVADNDVYAVGAAGVVAHYDGTAWSLVDPQPPTMDTLAGVWADGAGELVVIGGAGGAFRRTAGAWQTISSTPPEPQFAIWGTSVSDLIVVGDAGKINRYDGSTWTPMASNTALPLRAAWGASSSTMVAAGAGGVIQRYNGSSWQAAPATPITGLLFRGVWTSETKIVAVGNMTGTMTTAIIKTQESAGWNTTTVSAQYMTSVWGRADDDVYSVGPAGTIMHYDGATWTAMTSGTQSDLTAVAGTATNAFAVGANGTILRLAD